MEINFTELENKRWNDFQESHSGCMEYPGAIGGYVDIIVTPTSVGNFIKVRCNSCDVIEDITDTNKI